MRSKKITIRLDLPDLASLHHVMQYRDEDSMSQAIRGAIRNEHKLLYGNKQEPPADYQNHVAKVYKLN